MRGRRDGLGLGTGARKAGCQHAPREGDVLATFGDADLNGHAGRLVRTQARHPFPLVEFDQEVREEVAPSEYRDIDRAEDRLELDLMAVDFGHQTSVPDMVVRSPGPRIDGVLSARGEVDTKRRRPLLRKARGISAAVGQRKERERFPVGSRQPDRNRRLDRRAGDEACVGELALLRGSRSRQAPLPRRFVPGSAIRARLVRAGHSGCRHG